MRIPSVVRRHPKLVAVLASLVAVAAVTSPWWWRLAVFGAKLAVPAPAYERAAERTSDAAASFPGPPVPPTRSEPSPTTTGRPAIALGPLVDIETPTAVADPPGAGRLLVTTQDGKVLGVDLDTGATEVVLDIVERVSTGGERGLLGIAVDPAGSRMYLNFTNRRGDTEIRSWPMRNGSPSKRGEVLHLRIGQPFENHNGGNLVFGPDGMLWIGTGDGGGAGDRGRVAQDPKSLLGKMLRVDPLVSGGVRAPASNPRWTGRPEVWGIGLRNPWRYSFDRATNRLWVADVGQNSVEEISVADPDAPRPNFGWSVVEGSNRYHGRPSREFVEPAVEYRHDDGCSVTGGFVYRGAGIATLHGWYVFGDYCGGWIRAVRADDPAQRPVELAADVGPVISFAELEDGELLVLTPAGLRRVVAADGAG